MISYTIVQIALASSIFAQGFDPKIVALIIATGISGIIGLFIFIMGYKECICIAVWL
jgi:hypothetical protein